MPPADARAASAGSTSQRAGPGTEKALRVASAGGERGLRGFPVPGSRAAGRPDPLHRPSLPGGATRSPARPCRLRPAHRAAQLGPHRRALRPGPAGAVSGAGCKSERAGLGGRCSRPSGASGGGGAKWPPGLQPGGGARDREGPPGKGRPRRLVFVPGGAGKPPQWVWFLESGVPGTVAGEGRRPGGWGQPVCRVSQAGRVRPGGRPPASWRGKEARRGQEWRSGAPPPGLERRRPAGS